MITLTKGNSVIDVAVTIKTETFPSLCSNDKIVGNMLLAHKISYHCI